MVRVKAVMLAKADLLETESIIASFHRAAQNEKRYKPDKVFNADKYRESIERDGKVKKPVKLSKEFEKRVREDMMNMFNDDNFRIKEKGE